MGGSTVPGAVAEWPPESRPNRSTPIGSVLGLSATTVESPAPPITEWGFCDPDMAGIEALMSTLDTSEIPVPRKTDENPSALLLRQQATSIIAPAEEFHPGVSFESDEASRPSAVASCRVSHLAPLSLWARVTDSDAPVPVRATPDLVGHLLSQWMLTNTARKNRRFASSDLAAEIGKLTHPAHVAMTGLSPTCRIRGIRTTPDVVISEPLGEIPGWPEPALTPFPDTVSVVYFPESATERAEPAETPSAPVPQVAEPSNALSIPPHVDPALAEGAGDTGSLDEFEVVAVAAPALDALPIDLITTPIPSVDFDSFDTVTFDRGMTPPAEPEPVSVAPLVLDEPPQPQHAEPISDESELPQPQPVVPAIDEVAVAADLPALDVRTHVQESEIGPLAPLPDEHLSSDGPPPIVSQVSSQLPQPPARKRRRTALALG